MGHNEPNKNSNAYFWYAKEDENIQNTLLTINMC